MDITYIVDYIRNIFKNNSDGHDVAHTMRVYYEARIVANARHSFMESFLKEFEKEMGDKVVIQYKKR